MSRTTRVGVRAGGGTTSAMYRLPGGATPHRALTLGVVLLLGLADLPRPLAGDQALFLWTAQRLDQGAVLYRDIWDAKQPGIYALYWLSGKVFGFDEVGVHLGELLVLLVFAYVVQRTLPDLGVSAQVAALAPLAIVVPYQLLGTSWDITQLEPLIGLPLYVAFWASVRARSLVRETALPGAADVADPEREAVRLQVLAGAMIAVVAVFKLLYLPIGVVFLAWSIRGTPRRTRAVLAWAAGTALLGVPLLVWVSANGLVHEVWYTWVRFPGTSREQAAQPLSTLTSNARSFARTILPVGALAAVGLLASRRRLTPWMRLALAWTAVSLVLILVQFWWRYLYWNLSVPVGLFALVGATHVVDRIRARQAERGRTLLLGAGAALVLAVLVVVAALPDRDHYRAMAEYLVGGGDRQSLHAAEEPVYGNLPAVLAVLRATDAKPGPVVVFGSPIVQLAAGREQSGRIPGFLANTLGEREWRELADAMRRDPPAYVFIGDVQGTSVQDFIDERGALVQAALDESYCPAGDVPGGRWLVRCRDVGPVIATRAP